VVKLPKPQYNLFVKSSEIDTPSFEALARADFLSFLENPEESHIHAQYTPNARAWASSPHTTSIYKSNDRYDSLQMYSTLHTDNK